MESRQPMKITEIIPELPTTRAFAQRSHRIADKDMKMNREQSCRRNFFGVTTRSILQTLKKN